MGKKIEAIICDMDGTAVEYNNEGEFASSWDTLAKILTNEEKREWHSLTKKHYGKSTYEEWFNSQVKLLRGKKLSDAERFLFPVPYSPGFKEFFSNTNGLKKAILSAGIDIVAKRIAEELGFDYWVAQRLRIQNGTFTGTGERVIDGLDKSTLLFKISNLFNIPLSRTCYIGDTEGDIGCLNLVGLPVAYKPHHGLDNYAKIKGIPIISNFMELNDLLKKI